MPIHFVCPNCLADLTLKDQFAGECLSCPQCSAPIAVPELDSDGGPPGAPTWQSLDDGVSLSDPGGSDVTGSRASLGSHADSNAFDRVKFNCRQCGKKLSAVVAFAGQPINCPRCGNRQLVPQATGESGTIAASSSRSTPSLLGNGPAGGTAGGSRKPPNPAVSSTGAAAARASAKTGRAAVARSATAGATKTAQAGRGQNRLLIYAGGATAAAAAMAVLAVVMLRGPAPLAEPSFPADTATTNEPGPSTVPDSDTPPRIAKDAPSATPAAAPPRRSRKFPGRNLPPPPATVTAPRKPATPRIESAAPDPSTDTGADTEQSPAVPDESDVASEDSASPDETPPPANEMGTGQPEPAKPKAPREQISIVDKAPVLDEATAREIEEFLTLVEHTAEVRGGVLAVAQEITDLASARRLAAKWASLNVRCQALLVEQAAGSGKELVGRAAVRYTEAKTSDDQWAQAIEAEMQRIGEIPEIMPLLMQALDKRERGEAPDVSDEDVPTPKEKTRPSAPSSPALKRVRPK